MAELLFDRFLGLDKKASETDLDPRFATVLKNFSTTKKPGALVKDGAYTDVTDTLAGAAFPSGLTFKSLKEFGITTPLNGTVYLAHVQDGSNNHRIYVGPYHTFALSIHALTNGWRELTERVTEEITCGASTTTSSLVVNSGDSGYGDLSETNDAYNDFVVTINVAGGERTATTVSDYTYDSGAGTKTFALDAVVANLASGDTFYVARYALIADDSASGSLPGVNTVDDEIRWRERENAILGMTGNQSQFPTQYQLWYGYIGRTFGAGANGVAFNLFWFDSAQMIKPYVDDTPAGNRGSMMSPSTGSAGSLTAGTWEIYCAYVYDGFQIGPISDGFTLNNAGGDQITIAVNIPFQRCDNGTTYYAAHSITAADLPDNYSPYLLSRRVTAVRFYAQIPGGTDKLFVSERVIASSNTSDIDVTMLASLLMSQTFTNEISADPAGNTYEQDAGQTGLRPNFKYGISLGTHFIAAAIRTETGDRKNTNAIASVVDGAGVATPDVFGASNAINLAFYGSKEITGLAVFGDEGMDQSPKAKALIFADDDYYVLDIVSGSSFSHRLDNIGEKEGLFAPDSLVYAEKLLFGVSRNGFRIYAPQGTQMIGEGLKDDFDALTDPSEAIGSYHKKERLVLFHFATDSKTYAVDLLTQSLHMFEYSLADTFVWFTPARAGDLYALDASTIYQLGSGSDQDGTDIVPVLRTKRFTAKDMGGSDGFDIVLTEGVITYKSDSAITLNLYRNNSATAITWNNQNLAAQTTEQSRRFLFPEGSNGRELELEVTLSAAQAATNTDFRFNSLKVMGYLKRRVS